MKIKFVGVAVLSLALAIFGFAAVTNAQSFQSGDSSTIASGEVVDGSAYLSGSTIDVAGTVDGDLYCAGQNVTISGEVKGDILCAAQNINFTGKVSGDVRLIGQIITVSGDVGGSASIAGQTLTVESRGTIARDATLSGQNITLRGQVSRDVVVASGSAVLDGVVGRNVTANVNSLKLESKTDVGGTFNYTSPQTFSKAEGANIVGEVSYTQQKQQAYTNQNTNLYNPITLILWALMLIVSAVIFSLLFPQILHKVTGTTIASPSRSLGAVVIGFAAGIVAPFVIVLFMATVLGLPFALVLLIALCLIVALSGVFAAYYIGRLVWRGQSNIVLATFIGAVIISLLQLIPILNIFVTIVCVSYGSGALLMYLKNHFGVPKYTAASVRAKTETTH